MGNFLSSKKTATAYMSGSDAFDPRSPTTAFARTPLAMRRAALRFVDPRSPTVGIARTPVRSLANELRSPTVGIARTPVPAPVADDTLPDPRSPTVYFQRTPLLREKLAASLWQRDVRSPTTAFARTPLAAVVTHAVDIDDLVDTARPKRSRGVRRRLALADADDEMRSVEDITDCAAAAADDEFVLSTVDDMSTEAFDAAQWGAPLDASWAIIDTPFATFADEADEAECEQPIDATSDANVDAVVAGAALKLATYALDARRSPLKVNSFHTPRKLAAPRTPKTDLRHMAAFGHVAQPRHALTCPSSPAA
eukprot:TRINITY_DN1785_c0_g1_i4.p2 TRINITY_DN1785_c0_g1~~TRINITY_DN1785_c0_g1_i4.p2  ORF type:complete len:344 (+),score=202.18 TRINITY_DN1785_c0_g1_i4:105-1034(+)